MLVRSEGSGLRKGEREETGRVGEKGAGPLGPEVRERGSFLKEKIYITSLNFYESLFFSLNSKTMLTTSLNF